MRVEDINIRDPFILKGDIDGEYWLFGTTSRKNGLPRGFACWKTTDFQDFGEPYLAFVPEGELANTDCFWAPEVHRYKGRFYMFATMMPEGKNRGVYIFVSDVPQGPYTLVSNDAITPAEHMCLDGTPYIDADGKPWMVYCHEWLQIANGTIELIPLKDDLSAAIAPPQVLFHASDAPWVTPFNSKLHGDTPSYVTDGPFIFTHNGQLAMLWSSFKNGRYAQAVAISESGAIQGPWKHLPEPVYTEDGGHGMLFDAPNGQRMLSLHAPNSDKKERPHFIPFTMP